MRKQWMIAAVAMLFFVQPVSAETKEVDALPNRHVALYAQEQGGRYQEFELHIGDRKMMFSDWTSANVANVKPRLQALDVDHDGLDEVIVFLPKKRGNAVYLNEPKVLKLHENGQPLAEEIFVNDARTVLLQNVKYYKENEDFHVQLNGRDVLELKQEEKPPKLSVDSFVVYEIEDNALIAKVLLKSAKGEYLGTCQVRYDFKTTTMEPEKLSFIRH